MEDSAAHGALSMPPPPPPQPSNRLSNTRRPHGILVEPGSPASALQPKRSALNNALRARHSPDVRTVAKRPESSPAPCISTSTQQAQVSALDVRVAGSAPAQHEGGQRPMQPKAASGAPSSAQARAAAAAGAGAGAAGSRCTSSKQDPAAASSTGTGSSNSSSISQAERLSLQQCVVECVQRMVDSHQEPSPAAATSGAAGGGAHSSRQSVDALIAMHRLNGVFMGARSHEEAVMLADAAVATCGGQLLQPLLRAVGSGEPVSAVAYHCLTYLACSPKAVRLMSDAGLVPLLLGQLRLGSLLEPLLALSALSLLLALLASSRGDAEAPAGAGSGLPGQAASARRQQQQQQQGQAVQPAASRQQPEQRQPAEAGAAGQQHDGQQHQEQAPAEAVAVLADGTARGAIAVVCSFLKGSHGAARRLAVALLHELLLTRQGVLAATASPALRSSLDAAAAEATEQQLQSDIRAAQRMLRVMPQLLTGSG